MRCGAASWSPGKPSGARQNSMQTAIAENVLGMQDRKEGRAVVCGVVVVRECEVGKYGDAQSG